MKKTFLCFMVLFSLFSTYAQEKMFSNVLFDINLKELTQIISEKKVSEYKDTNILIDGVITEIRIIDSKNYIAELDIVSGEWFGLDEVKMYQITASITDKELFSRIPKSRSDTIDTNSIVAGRKIIGIVSLSEKDSDEVVILLNDVRVIN